MQNNHGAALPDWPEPRAAYIHVPFCRHRCGYCNFSVVSGRDDLAEAYLEGLTNELSRLECPHQVDTLFIGGGTPTHLPAAWLDRFLSLSKTWFPLATDAEFSVEANPGDINRERLEVLRRHGVNRLSLGVQSFSRPKLKTLERDHSSEIAQRAIEAAAESIGNISIDLIFAAPGETLTTWETDLRMALEKMPISHLSTYALTFEKGTQFWNRRRRGQLRPVAEATELAMYQRTRELTARYGCDQYEISNFAKPGRRCRHNVAYWEGRGWFAAGPGAAKFCDGRRQVNHRSPTVYIKRTLAGQDPTAEDEPIERRQWACERAAFGIRMMDGIDLSVLHRETGFDFETAFQEALKTLVGDGLLVHETPRIRLTDRGVLFADTVASAFLDGGE